MVKGFSQNRNKFCIEVTVDFNDDAGKRGGYSPENIDAMMSVLCEMGVRRVYWMHYGGASYDFMWRESGLPSSTNRVKTIQRLGNPIKVAVEAAKRHGLEIYALIKPYETGLSVAYPEGSPEAAQYGLLPCLGGSLPILMRFVHKHPEMRIQRRRDNIPPDVQQIPVNSIKIFKRNDFPTRIDKKNLQFWISNDNYCYTHRTTEFVFSNEVVPAQRNFVDSEGNIITKKLSPVRVLTLSGLNIRDKFILLTTDFKEGEGDFENTGVDIVTAFGPDGAELPISIATGYSIWFQEKVDFRKWGLVFDTGRGRRLIHLDAPNTSGRKGFVAFVRGRKEYLPGALCEVYPEVREFWLSMVQDCLNAGVDGVDFRIENHSTHTDNPFSYGFNDIIVAEYRRRYGKDVPMANFDLNLLAAVRGEYYTDFLRQAKRLIASFGKKMQGHLNVEFFRPNPRPSRYLAYPWNIQFDWRQWLQEGILDEATLRTFQYSPEFVLNDRFSNEVISCCQKYDIPLHYNRYIFPCGQSPAQYVKDLERVYRDGRFRSFIVYETASFIMPNGTKGVITEGDWFDLIRDKAKELTL